jgi:pyruvate/2-oxoacid:ferredoxin oxidoreductase beta subunit
MYEVENGKYKVTVPVTTPKPLGEFLKLQKRFECLLKDEQKSEQVRQEVEGQWLKLEKLAAN